MARKNVMEQVKGVAKESASKAGTGVKVKNIGIENLVPYPFNNEDVSYTADIEDGIKNGNFIEPLIVTNCEAVKECGVDLPEGKYMIIRGHRRCEAYKKQKVMEVGCIVRNDFSDKWAIEDCALSGNQYRNQDQDPLLLCERYRREEKLVEARGEKKVAEKVAERMGLSRQQADRYKQFNKVIKDVWVLVRAGKGGMSNFLMMASHSEEEQKEIFIMLADADEKGAQLTRSFVENLVKAYRSGVKSYAEYENNLNSEPKQEVVGSITGSGVSVMSGINTDPSETKENDDSDPLRTGEVNYDFSHREGLDGNKNEYTDERLTEEDYDAIEAVAKSGEKKEKEDKPELSEEEKKVEIGKNISKTIKKLDGMLEDFYDFDSSNDAEIMVNTMGSMITKFLDEMMSIADKYEKDSVYKQNLNEIQKYVNERLE